MNKNRLHITNGDSTTEILKKLGFKGEIITWREMLCEGRTTTDVGSEGFWKSRFNFFSSTYKVTKRSFIDKTVKEFRNLCNQKTQDEIVLWFEYDLFCQINMLAMISWLKTHRKGAHITLVCSGKEDNTKKLYGLGELSKDQIINLFEKRISLTIDDIEYADYMWHLYCSDSPLQMQTHARFNASQFRYLTEALETHLKRFPSIKNGLNDLENTILTTAVSKKHKTKEDLVKTLLKNPNYYGFGDIQYFKKLDDLKVLFKNFSPVYLTDLGLDIQEGAHNIYSQVKDPNVYLGGSLKYSFLYNDTNNKLLKL
ncbi:MAG: DUF1835 domain-containing protein [Flavobacteriaceae bacterium]|nr:DUF1835 domain-containing protein [Flavobacteriaceae bacterium]